MRKHFNVGLIIIFCLFSSLLIFLNIKNDFFPSNDILTINGLAEKSEDALGHEVWITNIQINDKVYDLEKLANDSWIVKDGNLIFVGLSPNTIEIPLTKDATVDISFYQFSYCGKALVSLGDNQSELNFYSEDLNYQNVSYTLSKTNMLENIALYILLLFYVVGVFYFLHKKKNLLWVFFPILFLVLTLLFDVRRLDLLLLIVYGVLCCFLIFQKQTKNIWSLLIPFNIFLFVNYFFTHLNFKMSNISVDSSFILTKIITLVVIYVIYYFITYSYKKIVKEKDKIYCNWIKISLIVFLINIIFLILVWPGNWVWDEKGILWMAQNYGYSCYQSYLSVIFYAVSLMLFPFIVGIVFFQVAIISLITGYIFNEIRQTLNNKKLIIILFILFMLPPIIMNNLYPLRSSICTYLEILLLFKGYQYFKKNQKLTITNYFVISFLTIVVSFWRSENIYYLILVPIGMLILFGKKLMVKKEVFSYASTIIVCLLIASPFLYLKSQSNTSIYSMTVYVNPLSNMLKEDYIIASEDYNNFSKVLKMDILDQHTSYIECPSFNYGVLQDNFEQYLPAFKKSYIRFVLDNYKLFLRVRTKTFLATTGMDKLYINNSPWGIYSSSYDTNDLEMMNLVNNDLLSKPINKNFRLATVMFLKGTISKDSSTISLLGQIIWNFLPSLFFIMIAILILLFKKKVKIGLLLMLALIKIPIIFITAPANYFFYYLTIYVLGIFILGYTLVKIFDKIITRVTQNGKK